MIYLKMFGLLVAYTLGAFFCILVLTARPNTALGLGGFIGTLVDSAVLGLLLTLATVVFFQRKRASR